MITIIMITLSNTYCIIILDILPGVITESNDGEPGVVYEVILNELRSGLVDPY
jgi:hypothetical protein